MFFEGSEKKLEIVLSTLSDNLRTKNWEPIVARAGARVLSQTSSPACDAYLLSESSLFVWEHRLTMITCGRTTLVEVALELFRQQGADLVQSLIFERKNEFFPQHQKSDVFEDLKKLNQHIHGKAYRLGEANEHYLFLFHLEKDFTPSPWDQTCEVLMYGIQGEASCVFTQVPHCLENIKSLFNHTVFQGFQRDEYVFHPLGYSCNGLKDDKYFTIHVTPQEISPYVSFETNMYSDLKGLVHGVIEIFQPKSFDLVGFHPSTPIFYEVSPYQMINKIHQKINCGYHVSFSSHYLPPSTPREAFVLNMEALS